MVNAYRGYQRALPFAYLVRGLLSIDAHCHKAASTIFTSFLMGIASRKDCETLGTILLVARYFLHIQLSCPTSFSEIFSTFHKMPQIGAEHRALLVNLAAWITLSAMIVFTSSKVATKWTMNRKFQSDDMLMIIAMVRSKPLGLKISYARTRLLTPLSSPLSVIALP